MDTLPLGRRNVILWLLKDAHRTRFDTRNTDWRLPERQLKKGSLRTGCISGCSPEVSSFCSRGWGAKQSSPAEQDLERMNLIAVFSWLRRFHFVPFAEYRKNPTASGITTAIPGLCCAFCTASFTFSSSNYWLRGWGKDSCPVSADSCTECCM